MLKSFWGQGKIRPPFFIREPPFIRTLRVYIIKFNVIEKFPYPEGRKDNMKSLVHLKLGQLLLKNISMILAISAFQ